MKMLAAKEFNKVFYKNGQKHRIKVKAELVHRDGNSNAYFSITGETERRGNNNRWVSESAGCIHEEILEQLPELKPLVLVHLADEHGVPMHAYENAGYWAGQTKWQKLDLTILAEHLRVDEVKAQDMLSFIENAWGEFDSITTPAMAWKSTCEDYELISQWQEEADKARAMLNQLTRLENAK